MKMMLQDKNHSIYEVSTLTASNNDYDIVPIYIESLKRYQLFFLDFRDADLQNTIIDYFKKEFLRVNQSITEELMSELAIFDILLLYDRIEDKFWILTNLDICISDILTDDDINCIFNLSANQYAIFSDFSKYERKIIQEL